MIDCLYNITAILQAPAANGVLFRTSGFKNALKSLQDDEDRFGGKPEWDSWIQKNRSGIGDRIRVSGLTRQAVDDSPSWPTMGQYVKRKKPLGVKDAHHTISGDLHLWRLAAVFSDGPRHF